MKMNSREKGLLIVTLSLSFLAIVQIGIIRPSFQKIKRIKTKAMISGQNLKRMKTILEKKERVETGYQAIKNSITSAKSSEREIIDMLLKIEEVAEESQVEIVQNVHKDDKPFEYFNQHTVGFRGVGNINQIMQMLHLLQDTELLLKIPKMEISVKNYKLEIDLNITRIIYNSEGDYGEN